MLLKIDLDILWSFCNALGVNWHTVDTYEAIFYLPEGPPDYVGCYWHEDGPIDVDVPDEAVPHYRTKIEEALEEKARARCKDRLKNNDEITALVVVQWLLR